MAANQLTEALLSFNAQQVSSVFNKIENQYAMVGQMNIFRSVPVATSYVVIEKRHNILTLLPPSEALSPAPIAKKGHREKHVIEVPKIQYNDAIKPEDIQNLTRYNGTGMEIMSEYLIERLTQIKLRHDLTKEYMMLGALRGNVIAGDGTTVYKNLFTEFGVTEKVITLDLDNTDADVRGNCRKIARHIDKNLFGDISTGKLVICDPVGFDRFTNHANVKAAFDGYQDARDRLGGNVDEGFMFGGLTFKVYDATVTASTGSSLEFMPTKVGRAFPEGTRNTFEIANAPADFNESVNSIGMEYYAKVEEAKFQRGYDIHSQCNPMPICKNPAVLVKVTM